MPYEMDYTYAKKHLTKDALSEMTQWAFSPAGRAGSTGPLQLGLPIRIGRPNSITGLDGYFLSGAPHRPSQVQQSHGGKPPLKM